MLKIKKTTIFFLAKLLSFTLTQRTLIAIFSRYFLKNQQSHQQAVVMNILGHAQLPLAVVSYLSLAFHTQLRLPLLLIDDGTLTTEDKKTLTFLSARVISTSKVNKILAAKKKAYPYLVSLITDKNFAVSRYKMAFPFLSQKKIILMEGDVLFLRQPKKIINWLKDENPTNKLWYLLHTIPAQHTQQSPIDVELTIRLLIARSLGVNFEPHLNTGLVCFNAQDIDFGFADKVAKLFLETRYSAFFSAEETMYGLFASRIKSSRPFNSKKYLVNLLNSEHHSIDKSQLVVRHYAGKSKPFFYLGALKWLSSLFLVTLRKRLNQQQ